MEEKGISGDGLTPFSANLRRYRRDNGGMTQKELSILLEVTQKTVSGWENITDEDRYPPLGRLRRIARTLGMPIWRLTGDMQTDDYRIQEVAGLLGIDPYCVTAIMDLAGMDADGGYEPLKDRSRELSALLISVDERLLDALAPLVRISWRDPERRDDPRKAAAAYERDMDAAARARFEAANALDAMLRDRFPVHDREDYFTPDALEKEREEERRRLEKTAARADAGKLRAAIEALAGMGRVLSAMRDDYEDAKRRIARPGTDAARLRP